MPSLSTLYDKFIRRATLTTQDKADILGDIGGQPLDADLTAYANAADAAARRALIGAEEAGIARLLIYDGSAITPPTTGFEVGTLALIPDGAASQLIYFTGESPDGWRNVITGELGWNSPS